MTFIALFTCLITALLVAVVHYLYKEIKFRQNYKLPPQVPGIPFFGNTFQIPRYNPGAWGKEQAAKYGEMFTCKIGSSTWVFLNSSRAVSDLLDKRAGMYSSRASFPMGFDTMSGGNSIVLMPYGARWRACRKAFHSVLSKTNMSSFAPYQDLESKQYLLDVMREPEHWHTAGKRYANSVIMSIVFGKRARGEDPHIKTLFELTADISAALLPGTWLVDGFPFLDRILPTPLKWWLPKGLEIRRKSKALFGGLAQEVLDKHARGEGKDCFTWQFMNNKETKDFEWDMKCFLLGDLIQGGTDTTYVSSSIVLAAAAKYPDWVKRAQEELDRVCGPNAERLPTFEDRENLPYISAVIKEAVRWRPLLQIGLGHVLIKDDEYKDYRFPAGTVFTWNAWAISFNPEEYEDPETFKPERFLNADVDNVLKGHYSFGPGRRVCAGYNVADTNLWILVARLLYCFDLAEDLDHPIDTVAGTELLRLQEKEEAPFTLRLKPRSPAHVALIESVAEEANLTVD